MKTETVWPFFPRDTFALSSSSAACDDREASAPGRSACMVEFFGRAQVESIVFSVETARIVDFSDLHEDAGVFDKRIPERVHGSGDRSHGLRRRFAAGENIASQPRTGKGLRARPEETGPGTA